MDFTSSLRGGVSGDDPDDGAGSGVPRLRREPQRGRSGTPPIRPLGLTRAGRSSAPVPLPEAAARVPGRKSPRRSAERASRLQRDGPRFAHAVVAPRTRDITEECACRRSATPSLGADLEKKGTTRTPQGAAGWRTAGRGNEPRAKKPASGVFPCAAGWTSLATLEQFAIATEAIGRRVSSAASDVPFQGETHPWLE